MKCLIVDDEVLARQRLIRMLKESGKVVHCYEAANGEQAVQAVKTTQPDLVLMDIRMPGMDGLEAAHIIGQFDSAPAIVFTTAYGDHALAAFEAQAVDYLLKPIDRKRLLIAIDKSKRLSVATLAMAANASGTQRAYLSGSVAGVLKRIPTEDVIYLFAENKYVEVKSASETLLIEDSLKSLEEEFSDVFVRVHRNALVNKKALRGLQKETDGKHSVLLKGTEKKLEVSRRLLSDVRRLLKS